MSLTQNGEIFRQASEYNGIDYRDFWGLGRPSCAIKKGKQEEETETLLQTFDHKARFADGVTAGAIRELTDA